MGKQELDNLVGIKKLKLEAGSLKEFEGMLASARTRLADAQNESLDPDSQFDLAYGPRIGWLSPRSVIKATGPKTELRFSRRSFTLSAGTTPIFKSS